MRRGLAGVAHAVRVDLGAQLGVLHAQRVNLTAMVLDFINCAVVVNRHVANIVVETLDFANGYEAYQYAGNSQ